MKNAKLPMLLCSVAAIVLAQASPVAAQAAAPASSVADAVDSGVGVKEIIVTAQRKQERLQDVPIAVNVISGAALVSRGATLSTELPTLVPGLTFATTGGGAGTPYLRGVGSNAANPNDEPSVATYIDGVYIASPYANTLDMAGLERVEVLKGPQGTLFGRNATGGVIQLITKDPSFTPALEATAGYANYNTVSGSAYATAGLGQNVAFNISAQGYDQSKGWGYNAVRKEETYTSQGGSLRGKLLIQASDDHRYVLSADYSVLKGHMADYRLPLGAIGVDGQPSPANGYDTRSIITTIPGLRAPSNLNRQFGFSLHGDDDIGFAHLVTILAYRKSSGYYHAEADATPLSLVAADLPLYQKNYSAEVQIVSQKESKVDWTVGGYYYWNHSGYQGFTFAVPPSSAPAPLIGDTFQKTKSASVYAQITAEVMPKLKATGGIRYTDEKLSLDGRIGLEGILTPFAVTDNSGLGYKRATYRLALDYALNNDSHAYVSFNHGVKGGGYDVLSIFNALGGAPVTSFKPEVLNAYEAGIKSTLFDRKLRLNVSGFWYDYTNIQVQVIPAGSASASVVQTTNAASARIKGIDADFELRPVKGLAITGGAAYIDGKYGTFTNTVAYGNAGPNGVPVDASGQPTLRTPKFTGNLAVSYEAELGAGKLTPSVSVSHNSGFDFGVTGFQIIGGKTSTVAAPPSLRNQAYTLLNAALSYDFADGRYGVRIWGSNLTKEYYLAQGVPSGLGALTAPAAPRTYGITLRAKFGG